MKRYVVTIPYHGWITYVVEAEDAEDAKRRLIDRPSVAFLTKKGEGAWDEETEDWEVEEDEPKRGKK